MSDLISIAEAAFRLGRKPWEVVRLLEQGRLRQAVLVEAASVRDFEEQQ